MHYSHKLVNIVRWKCGLIFRRRKQFINLCIVKIFRVPGSQFCHILVKYLNELELSIQMRTLPSFLVAREQ